MIKLNDQKKLAEDRNYYKKCEIFFILSLIGIMAELILLLILLLRIPPLTFNLFFVFFMVMCLVLMSLRSAQLQKAKEIWDQKFQAIEEGFANKT